MISKTLAMIIRKLKEHKIFLPVISINFSMKVLSQELVTHTQECAKMQHRASSNGSERSI